MRVRIYTKPRCSVCDETRTLLLELAGRLGFTVEVVDARASADTWERFRFLVPVVELDGEVVSTLRPDAAALEARLRGTHVA